MKPIQPVDRNTITSLSTAEAESSTAKESTQNQALVNSYYRVEIGDVSFDKRSGEIIGYPYISFVTGQHDYAEFIVDDDFDAVRERIDEEDEVSIYIGFGLSYEEKVMVGKIAKYGKHYPNGTIISVADFSSESQDGTTKVVDAKTGEENEEEHATDTDSTKAKTTAEEVSELNTGFTVRVDVAASALTAKKDNELTYKNNSKIATDKAGEVVIDESNTKAATREAKLVGDEIVSEGKEIIRVSPGEGVDSGIVLDYIANRSVFTGKPKITKRTDNQPKGGGGSWTVSGWNSDRKSVVAATVVVPSKLKYDSNKKIKILKTELLLGQPIFEDSVYSWGDATLGGKRIPDTQKIVDRIIAIARVIDKLTKEKTQGKKWQIISWYNNSKDEETIHTLGSAVDVYYDGIEKLFKELEPTWSGGLAYHPGSLMHIDNRHEDGEPQLRWTY